MLMKKRAGVRSVIVFLLLDSYFFPSFSFFPFFFALLEVKGTKFLIFTVLGTLMYSDLFLPQYNCPLKLIL